MKKQPHHGELLKKLVAWTGKSHTQFALTIEFSRQWLNESFEEERIKHKNLITICRALSIPESYWNGDYELPMVPSIVNEEVVVYQSLSRTLQEEINLLKETNRLLNIEMVALQKRVIEMQDEKENFRPSPQKTHR